MSNEEYLGKPFRQLSRRIRLQRGAGHPDKVSTRPYRENRDGSITYLDSDQQPTLVIFDERDLVDIPMLLQTGAIVPWQPSKPKLGKPEKPVEAPASPEVHDG